MYYYMYVLFPINTCYICVTCKGDRGHKRIKYDNILILKCYYNGVIKI